LDSYGHIYQKIPNPVSIFEVKLVRALLVLRFGDNVGTPGCCSFLFCH